MSQLTPEEEEKILHSLPKGTFALLLVFLVLWSVVIVAHILRHALSITAIPAGLLAIGYTLLNFELSSQLLGLASN